MFRKGNSKKNKRKRAVSTGSNSDTNDNSSSGDNDDKLSSVLKQSNSSKKKKNQFTTGSGKKKATEDPNLIASDKGIVRQSYAGGATYESQIDTEKDRDARAILERNIKRNQDGSADTESGKIYKGKAGYKNYVTKKESQVGLNKVTGTQGPIRAQTWARSICRFDYAPDICKDYKDTGFCGYGDSCKFLHDRSDHKAGWQIEKEYQEKQRKRQQQLVDGKSIESDDDNDDKYVIKSDDEEQFACTICREPFINAVETQCGHFFCQKCALGYYKKSSRCFNCRKQTNGVFNVATKLRARESSVASVNSDGESIDVTADDSADNEGNRSQVTSGGGIGNWSVVS